MTAEQAISYIEHYGWSTTRLGLGRTRELLEKLGDPQKHLKFIHVAGSNGKGSTCAMFDAVLRAAGYRTGLYTSPHIQDFCERIRVNGENIPGDALAELTERVMAIAEAMEDHPSQFELVTAVAMQYFYEQGCELVVLEVGLGGALDSTNAIDAPVLAVITNLGLEHTEYLGNTMAEIASAKAGIIKPGCRCVCYDCAPEAAEVVRRVCAENNVPLYIADFSRIAPESASLEGWEFAWDGAEYRLPLIGEHQLCNAAVALTGIGVLRELGWNVPEEAVREGLRTVRWPARMEVLGRAPLFLLDGGHNPQCAQALAASLDRLLSGQRPVFLIGVLADKDYASILDIVQPYAGAFVCVTPDSPRRLMAEELALLLRERGADAAACDSISEGVYTALEKAAETGTGVVAFGSLYLAGAVRSSFRTQYRRWLRRCGIQAREGIEAQEREERSARAAERIASSEAFRSANTVFIYEHFRAELSLEALVRHPAAAGKRFAYPICLDDREMAALAPGGMDAWRAGEYGILEPVPELSQELAPEEINLVICPCAAFDAACNRLGMGEGYYDRYLPRCVNAAVAAAAFESQRAERIPAEAWDRPMDMVFTEDRVYFRH